MLVTAAALYKPQSTEQHLLHIVLVPVEIFNNPDASCKGQVLQPGPSTSDKVFSKMIVQFVHNVVPLHYTNFGSLCFQISVG